MEMSLDDFWTLYVTASIFYLTCNLFRYDQAMLISVGTAL